MAPEPHKILSFPKEVAFVEISCRSTDSLLKFAKIQKLFRRSAIPAKKEGLDKPQHQILSLLGGFEAILRFKV